MTNMMRFYEMLHENLPEVEVSEEEYIAAMIADGKSEAKAKMHAKISQALGASTRVGDKMLKIKKEDPTGV
jgi:hypothetical protein